MSLSFKKNYISHQKFRWDFSLSSNPFGPSPKVTHELMSRMSDNELFYSYPAGEYQELKDVITSFYNVKQEDVFLGAGLDGLIFDIINLYLDPQDELIIPQVTFRNIMYAAYQKNAIVTQIPMNLDLSVDFDRLIKSINGKTKIIFLCNPNNPTGIYESLDSIKKLLESTNALIVLDEANIEFSGGSGLHLIEQFNNLLVLRTLSKAYGLAGIRVGYGISKSVQLKEIMHKRPPFFISKISEIAASCAIKDQTYLDYMVDLILKEKFFLESQLKNMGFHVVGSQSNTLLCKIPAHISSASVLIENLHKHDCHVVNGVYFNLDDYYVRIAPKVHEDNKVLIGILNRVI